MNNKQLIIILLVLSSLTSCDSFLDVRPEGQVVNNELFEHADGFEDALYGVYGQMAGESLYGRKLTFYMNDVLAQYYSVNLPNDTTNYLCTYQYTHQTVRPMIDAVWSDLYRTIGYVNNILYNLQGHSTADMPYYHVYRAECLGLRAFLHFELMRFYSENYVNNPSAQGVPYKENYSYTVSPFLTAMETYDKIIADLKEAETLMLSEGEYFDADANTIRGFMQDRNTHMNLYAIEATLARVYWTMGKMQEAATYARKVINSGQFSLADKSEITDLMNGVLSSKETIFGLYSNAYYSMVYQHLFLYDRGLILKDEHDDDYMADREGVDFRYENWFKYYSSSRYTNGLRCIKVFDEYRLESKSRSTTALPGLSLIRLPEMYYIVSEYELSVNQPEQAANMLDQVLVSRGLTPYSQRTGVTLTLDNLIRERKKELICEGQYFHTLKRYNQSVYESRSGQHFTASNDIYVFPLPEDEINYRQ